MKKKNKISQEINELKLKAGVALSKFKPQTFVSKKDKRDHSRQIQKQELKKIIEED